MHAQTTKLSPADKFSIITIQDGNISIRTASLTDRHSINGLQLGHTSATDIPPDWMRCFGAAVWEEDRRIRRGIPTLPFGVRGMGPGAGSLQNGFRNTIGQGYGAGWYY